MIAVIMVYKRPELLSRLYERIIQTDSRFLNLTGKNVFSRILLVQDGIRNYENEYSKKSYDKAREFCGSLEARDSRVELLTFSDNQGLTQHIFRTLNHIGSEASDCIFFEEDKAPTLAGLEFLFTRSKNMSSYSLLDTLPLNKHTHIKQDSISTMFTDNGNIVYGDDLFDLAKHLWEVKDKYQSNFQINLYEYFELFLKGFALRRAVNYYSNHFSWGLFNPDRPDSLFSYALVLTRSMKTCPLIPSSNNWSDQDLRGKNVTTVPENRSAPCKCDIKSIWSRPVCSCCEKQGTSERVKLSLLSSLVNSTSYKIGKLLNP